MDLHTLARALIDKHTHRPSSSGRTTPDEITPFPIRLIHENAPRRRRSVSSIANKPQNDEFYRFWDRFLATSPNRDLKTSAIGRRLEQTLKNAVDAENGLHTQESPAASYKQAKKECQAKVQAIVAECTRLNQRYRDRQFEVELSQHDCIVPLVDDDGNSIAIQPSGVKRVMVCIHHDVRHSYMLIHLIGHIREACFQRRRSLWRRCHAGLVGKLLVHRSPRVCRRKTRTHATPLRCSR